MPQEGILLNASLPGSFYLWLHPVSMVTLWALWVGNYVFILYLYNIWKKRYAYWSPQWEGALLSSHYLLWINQSWEKEKISREIVDLAEEWR